MWGINGKKPLRLLCPRCGRQGQHPVVKTDPGNYHWGEETAPLFMRIVGRDLAYRQRTKECIYCRQQFASVEMSRVYLEAMIQEIKRQEQQIKQLQDRCQLEELLAGTIDLERIEYKHEANSLRQENTRLWGELDRLKEGLFQLVDLTTDLTGIRKDPVTPPG